MTAAPMSPPMAPPMAPLATGAPTPAPAMPAVTSVNVAGPTSMVQIRNVGFYDFVKEYHIDTIRIPAGQSMIVMWDIMVYWLGNPSLSDESIRQRDRTHEYDRLRVLYGAYEDDRVWEVNRPRLEVYALTGERIWTVAEDPTGTHVTPASQSVAYAASYEAQIAVMQRQIDALQAMMSQQAAVTPAVAETPVAPAGMQSPAPPDITRVSGPSVHDATVSEPPTPSPTQPPFEPTGPPPFNPNPAPPFNESSAQTMPIDPRDNHGQWIDTTPAPPTNIPPFKVDGPPEDTAPGPRVS